MIVEFTNTETLEEARIVDELKEIVPALIEDGMQVSYRPETYGNKKQAYIYIIKDGNVGTVQYPDYVPFGYSASFSIKPSREAGSAIGTVPLVTEGDGTTFDVPVIVQAAKIAVKDEIVSWFDDKTYPNHGTDALWSCENLVEIVL